MVEGWTAERSRASEEPRSSLRAQSNGESSTTFRTAVPGRGLVFRADELQICVLRLCRGRTPAWVSNSMDSASASPGWGRSFLVPGPVRRRDAATVRARASIFRPKLVACLCSNFEIAIDFLIPPVQTLRMGQSAIKHCPLCNRPMAFVLPPGGKGPRTFQCLDCDRRDPLESESIKGWLQGELGRGKSA